MPTRSVANSAPGSDSRDAAPPPAPEKSRQGGRIPSSPPPHAYYRPARAPPVARYDVEAVIENKPGLSDPEGSTILEDLVLKGSHPGVSAVRTAKMIRFTVSAPSARAAAADVRRMCDELRVYNPLVSALSVSASAARGRPRAAASRGGARRRPGSN